MKFLLLILICLQFLFISCTKVRESAGVTRKSLDEFTVIENPPLIIPPDFYLLPPEQLEEKNIENVEKELAEEILFGLDENLSEKQTNSTTMTQILEKSNASQYEDEFRNQFDEEFANEVKTKGIFENDWINKEDVLDSVKESERIRSKLASGEKLEETQEQIIEEEKPKKKKRFFFF